MKKSLLLTLSILLTLSMILSACATAAPATQAGPEAPAAPVEEAEVTLKVLVHQNPPMVDFMTKFNEEFTARHPNIKIDMAVVNANDLSTVTQTRLTANDVDIVDIFGFANAAQPFMKNVDPPNW
mgnify:FL=1